VLVAVSWLIARGALGQGPTAAETLPPQTPGLLSAFKLDYTYLPRLADRGLEMNEAELVATLAVPLGEHCPPLLVTPGFACRFWGNPGAGRPNQAPDLPSRLFDATLDLGWKPRLAEWLFADVGITPGVYSDFRDVNADSFQLRGCGLATVAFAPQLQVVAGALYVNRNITKVLPAGGVVWSPDEDTRCVIVFPAPKVSHRLGTLAGTPLWGYVGGEFGGGRWSVERASGTIDSLDYTDLRAFGGLEWGPPGVSGGIWKRATFSAVG
jgi:hypothetical protein